MSAPVSIEWENHNSLRSYPFREGSALTVSELPVQLPIDALLDLFCFVQPSGDETFYLSSIEVKQDISLELRFSGVSTNTQVALAKIPRLFSPQASFEIAGSGWGTSGKLVIGPGLLEVQRWGVGVFSFLAAQAELEASVMVPIDLGVVTSVGIENVEEVLVGDVRLEFGRAMEGGPDLSNNSIVISAIKRSDDCEEETLGCPLKSINGLLPDPSGNIVLSTEGIFQWEKQENGLAIRSIWDISEQCPTIFTPALRGSDGGAGPAGPRGPNGLNRLCSGGICCECQTCDSCEQWDNALSPPRIINNTFSTASGSEGDPVKIYGVDLLYERTKPDNSTFRVEFVTAVTFCKPDGTQIEVPFVGDVEANCVNATIPVGLTSVPSVDGKYSLRLKTPWGWTNSIDICVLPATVATKMEAMDLTGSWVKATPPPTTFALETVGHFEGTGAFILGGVTSILSCIVANITSLSGLGAPPWNLSVFTDLTMWVAKELDPLALPGPAGVAIILNDGVASGPQAFTAVVPPASLFPPPHVVSPGDFSKVTFSLAAATVDLTDITAIGVQVFDSGTTVPIKGWADCLEGI